MAGLGGGAPFGDASPPGDGSTASRKGLARVAGSAGMPFLAYLINVALEEAKVEKARD